MESFSGQRVLKEQESGLPLGAVLGTAVVTDFHRTELIVPSLTRREIAFGDYTSGSWAWRLDDVVMLPEAKVEDGVQCLISKIRQP